MEKKIILAGLTTSLMICLAWTCNAQTAVRASYLFYYKQDSTRTGYHLAPDMTLDFDGSKAAFYSETEFTKDSLSLSAFDKDGNTVDNKAENALYDLSGKGFEDWICFSDYTTDDVQLHYDLVFTHLVGKAKLPAPEWVLQDGQKEVLGYLCKQARTHYLGRTWFVWYTEEIPVSAGPWLLRGLPGLILAAEDSNRYFLFKLQWIEPGIQSRYASYLHIQEVLRARKKGKYPFPDSYPLPQANRMAAKSRMSGYYRDQILGTKMFSIPGYTILPNGQKKMITTEHPYIPLIPESFGKNIR